MDTLDTGRQRHATTRGRWAPHHTLWFWLLLGWTVSAADRALTGPVVTWMIGNHVSFLADTSKPTRWAGSSAASSSRATCSRSGPAAPSATATATGPSSPSASCGPASRRCSRRAHRPRPLHRHPGADRPGHGGLLLQRPQPDRREDARGGAGPREPARAAGPTVAAHGRLAPPCASRESFAGRALHSRLVPAHGSPDSAGHGRRR